MKILVTGGAGFIGSNLVDKYVSIGHDVVVIDDLSTGNIQFINPKAKFIRMCLLDSRLEEVFKQEKFDLINHHAAQINVRKSVEQPLNDLDINLYASVKLFHIAARSGVKKVIFASSGGTVYGETPRTPVDENFVGRPISPYGINKLAAEQYLLFLGKQYGFKWTILRYANVYGPRQSSQGESGVISIFLDRINKNLHLIVYGDGEQVRDFIHVYDVVSANLFVSDLNDSLNQILNVGTGVGTSINGLLSLLQNLSQRSISIEYVKKKPGELQWNVLSSAKFHSFGWSSSIELEQGIKLYSGL